MRKLIYFSFFAAAGILSFYKVGLLASMLGKHDFGSYSLVLSSYVYVIYISSFGANEYVLKMGSFSNDCIERRGYRNKALLHGLLSVLLGCVLLTLIASSLFSEFYYSVVLCCVFLALSGVVYNVFESFFRSEGSLLSFSGMMLSKGMVIIFLLLATDFVEDFVDAVVVELLAFLSVVVFVLFYLYWRGDSFGVRFSLLSYKLMIRDGYALSLSTMLKNSIGLIDKLFISLFLGVTLLGYYAYSMIVYQAALLGAGVVMSLLGPKILVAVKDGLVLSVLSKRLLISFLIIFIASFLFFWPLEYVYRLVVAHYFEGYDDEITYSLFPFVYAASVVMFVSSLAEWFFVAASKERFLACLSFVSLVFSVVGFAVVGYMSLPVLGFVVVFLFCRSFVVIVQTLYMLREFLAGEIVYDVK